MTTTMTPQKQYLAVYSHKESDISVSEHYIKSLRILHHLVCSDRIADICHNRITQSYMRSKLGISVEPYATATKQKNKDIDIGTPIPIERGSNPSYTYETYPTVICLLLKSANSKSTFENLNEFNDQEIRDFVEDTTNICGYLYCFDKTKSVLSTRFTYCKPIVYKYLYLDVICTSSVKDCKQGGTIMIAGLIELAKQLGYDSVQLNSISPVITYYYSLGFRLTFPITNTSNDYTRNKRSDGLNKYISLERKVGQSIHDLNLFIKTTLSSVASNLLTKAEADVKIEDENDRVIGNIINETKNSKYLTDLYYGQNGLPYEYMISDKLKNTELYKHLDDSNIKRSGIKLDKLMDKYVSMYSYDFTLNYVPFAYLQKTTFTSGNQSASVSASISKSYSGVTPKTKAKASSSVKPKTKAKASSSVKPKTKAKSYSSVTPKTKAKSYSSVTPKSARLKASVNATAQKIINQIKSSSSGVRRSSRIRNRP